MVVMDEMEDRGPNGLGSVERDWTCSLLAAPGWKLMAYQHVRYVPSSQVPEGTLRTRRVHKAMGRIHYGAAGCHTADRFGFWGF